MQRAGQKSRLAEVQRLAGELERTADRRVPPSEAHLVLIFHENGCCKVEPPLLHARKGNTVFWQVDGSAGAVRLLFPDAQLFGKNVYDVPAGTTLELTVKGNMGRYPYASHCQSHNCFAEGNSPPVIILDP